MANILKGFLDKLNLEESEDDGYDTEESIDYKVDDVKDFMDDEDEEPVSPKRNKFRKKPVVDSFDSEEEVPEVRPTRQPRRNSGKNYSNVVNINTRPSGGVGNMEVKVIRPKEYDESKDICDTLKDGMPIVLNLEGINSELAQKILDFTSGAVYAMNGNLQKVTSYIFIITPSNVPISGNFDEFIETASEFAGSKYGFRD